MNKLDLKLFEHLMNIPSPTGYTKNAINFIDEYCHNLGYKTERNKKGNLFVHDRTRTLPNKRQNSIC